MADHPPPFSSYFPPLSSSTWAQITAAAADPTAGGRPLGAALGPALGAALRLAADPSALDVAAPGVVRPLQGAAPGAVRPPPPGLAAPGRAPEGVCPPPIAPVHGDRPPGAPSARLQGPPSAAASLMATGAGTDTGTLPADAAADATGALDALVVEVGPAAMAAGAAAAMAAGLGMPTGANDTLLRLTASTSAPPPASHLNSSAAALTAARAAVAEGMARAREAALAWERERDAADTLARQVAEAEQLLGIPASTDLGATSSAGPRVAHTAAAGPRVLWHDPADPLVTQLHYQAGGVQNIRLLVPVVLEPESPSYARWRDLVLLTLRRYALDDHVLVDASAAVQTSAWLRLDSIVLSWILGTISLDLHDLVRNTPSARGAWLALEGQFLGQRRGPGTATRRELPHLRPGRSLRQRVLPPDEGHGGLSRRPRLARGGPYLGPQRPSRAQ